MACFSPETAAGSQQLKDFLRRTVYQSDRLAEERKQSVRPDREPVRILHGASGSLPANYLEESAGKPLHRAVCDYIAGMTDGFLLRTC